MTEKQIMTDILIVGAGTAGLTAAVYAARAGKSVKLVEQYLQGGQIINASHVENFPGFESIAGFEFAEALYNQAVKMGAEIVYDKVTGLQDYGSHKGVQTEYGGELLAKAVILATGYVRWAWKMKTVLLVPAFPTALPVTEPFLKIKT